MHVCKKSGLLGPRWWLVFDRGGVLVVDLHGSDVALDWCGPGGGRRHLVACSRALAIRRVAVAISALWLIVGWF